ncbi:b3 domain-containing transcription factor vrn1 [Quercus suber]|uniref:B3 domain-containing transcription factor vrn1 n=1 Tax=Quercus suber TaxID=58331 RepID=A0AAW0M8X8_QUESU
MTSQCRRDNGDGLADLTTHFPHFFKIIMPQTLAEGKLFFFLQRIPKKFISEYGDLQIWLSYDSKWYKMDSEVDKTYEGNSQFSVLIFDATATKVDYPAVELQVRRMEDNESDDNSIEIIDGFMPSRETGKKPPVPCLLPHKRQKTNPSMLEKSKRQFGVSFTRGESSGLAHGVGRNRVGCKSSSLVKLESDCNLDESFSHDHCPKKDGGVAKNHVRANALKSENPLFMVIIHPSYINGKDHASLPYSIINYLLREGFTMDYTKGSTLTVKLEVVDRFWPVKLYIYEGKYSSCVVFAGWSAFARDNTLRVGDVCIFELNMRDDVVFKVHIFRCLD